MKEGERTPAPCGWQSRIDKHNYKYVILTNQILVTIFVAGHS